MRGVRHPEAEGLSNEGSAGWASNRPRIRHRSFAIVAARPYDRLAIEAISAWHRADNDRGLRAHRLSVLIRR